MLSAHSLHFDEWGKRRQRIMERFRMNTRLQFYYMDTIETYKQNQRIPVLINTHVQL